MNLSIPPNEFAIQDFFFLGMKRDINALAHPDLSMALNLGPGNNPIHGTIGLDYPEWNGENDPIPYPDGTVTAIFAMHFLEHFTGAQVIRLMREAERVLTKYGTMNIVVPYYSANIAAQDLDHKAFFTEETWKTLFNNNHYDKNREKDWDFVINANFIMGVAERNMALFTQLIKQ